VTMIGWLVTEKLVQTKHGEPMEFITLEDLTALYDATLFPDIYRRVCHSLLPDHAYILRGQIEEEFGAITFIVQELQCLKSPAAPPAKERISVEIPHAIF
jgi:error-prone DNA polymerase